MKKYILPLLFLFSACRPVAATPTTPAKPTAVLVATSTATVHPINTDTATPTMTTVPTLPNRPLAENGPWLLLHLDKALAAMNPDGTGYTVLAENTTLELTDKIRNVAVQGNIIAYVEGSTYEAPEKMLLKLRTLQGKELAQIELGKGLNESAFRAFTIGNDEKTPYDQYLDNIAAIGELAWSPNGKYLAFTGAIDGYTSDVYVYSVADGSLKRLSDAATEAVNLNWTPDSRYIVHAAAISLNIGRSGGGYDLSALWAVSPDGSETKKLLNLASDIQIFGWAGASKLVFAHFESGMSPYDTQLQILDVNTKEITNWFDDYFEQGTYDPKDQTFLLSVNSHDTAGLKQKHPDGTYLLTRNKPPQKISDMVLGKWRSRWQPEIERFLVTDINDNTYTISANGQIEKTPFLDQYQTTISPDGKYWSTINADYSGTLTGQDSVYKFQIGDWNGHIQDVTTWASSTSDSVQSWSPDSHYCYLITRTNLVIISASDFKILNTIPIAPSSATGELPIWVAP